MGLVERLRALFPQKPCAPEDPWCVAEAQPVAPVVEGNPWRDKRFWDAPAAKAPMVKPADVWKAPNHIGKNWVLHKAAFAVILLNVVLALFFTSNNLQFNTALYLYLGTSTILLAHYWGMTRGA